MTPADIASLDAPALNRFIAEQLGQHVHDWAHDPNTMRTYVCATCKQRRPGGQTSVPPDYTTDPRALHEAEKVLMDAGWTLIVNVWKNHAEVTWLAPFPTDLPKVVGYTETPVRARALAAALEERAAR